MTPAWWVIVLSWNGREDALTCLESLRGVKEPEIGVVLVDNGSTDGTAEAVRERFPEVHLVETGENLGFPGGNNAGIGYALDQGAEWVVLLNNDATVAPDSIKAFALAARARPRAGVLGGKVFYDDPPDLIWFAGQRFRLLLGYSGKPRGYGKKDGPEYDETIETDRAVGAFMAVSRQAMDTAGLMAEELFSYVEDTEWCVRIRKAGFEVLITPEARAWHAITAATGGEARSTATIYYGTRNTIVVTERHKPLGRLGNVARRAVVLLTFTLYALTRANRREALAAVREGYADLSAGRLGKRRA